VGVVTSPEVMADAYRALAQRAWTSNRARAEQLIAWLGDWRSAGMLAAEGREHGRAVVHSLRGSAGTFGHEAAADAAEELEELLIGDAQPQLDLVADLVAQIDFALTEPPDLS